MQCRGQGGTQTTQGRGTWHHIRTHRHPEHPKLQVPQSDDAMQRKTSAAGPSKTSHALTKSQRWPPKAIVKVQKTQKQASPEIPLNKKRPHGNESSQIAIPNALATAFTTTTACCTPQGGLTTALATARLANWTHRCPICFLWDCEAVHAAALSATRTAVPVPLRPLPKRALMPERKRSLAQVHAQLGAPPVTAPAAFVTFPPGRFRPKACSCMCEIRCAPQCRERCGYPAGHREFHCCWRCLEGPQLLQASHVASATRSATSGVATRGASFGTIATPSALPTQLSLRHDYARVCFWHSHALRHAQRAAAAAAATAESSSSKSSSSSEFIDDGYFCGRLRTNTHCENSDLCLREGSTTTGQILASLLFKVCTGTARSAQYRWQACYQRVANGSIIRITSEDILTDHAQVFPSGT